jgi:hypothetical protein
LPFCNTLRELKGLDSSTLPYTNQAPIARAPRENEQRPNKFLQNASSEDAGSRRSQIRQLRNLEEKSKLVPVEVMRNLGLTGPYETFPVEHCTAKDRIIFDGREWLLSVEETDQYCFLCADNKELGQYTVLSYANEKEVYYMIGPASNPKGLLKKVRRIDEGNYVYIVKGVPKSAQISGNDQASNGPENPSVKKVTSSSSDLVPSSNDLASLSSGSAGFLAVRQRIKSPSGISTVTGLRRRSLTSEIAAKMNFRSLKELDEFKRRMNALNLEEVAEPKLTRLPASSSPGYIAILNLDASNGPLSWFHVF